MIDLREFQIRVIYCGASHKGPDPPRIGLIYITENRKYIVITMISTLRRGIITVIDPLIVISYDQVKIFT